jgi:hypothetical protein
VLEGKGCHRRQPLHTGFELKLQHDIQNHGAVNRQRMRTAAATSVSLITRLRGRSFDELRVRGMQALHARMERLWDGLSTRLPSRAPQPSAEPFLLLVPPFLAGV